MLRVNRTNCNDNEKCSEKHIYALVRQAPSDTEQRYHICVLQKINYGDVDSWRFIPLTPYAGHACSYGIDRQMDFRQALSNMAERYRHTLSTLEGENGSTATRDPNIRLHAVFRFKTQQEFFRWANKITKKIIKGEI